MVVVIFKSRIKDGVASEYSKRADEMAEIAKSMPGFISYKAYTATDGERVSIHEWESQASLEAWRSHPEHLKMQARGRDHFYTEYTLYACNEPRESRFQKEN